MGEVINLDSRRRVSTSTLADASGNLIPEVMFGLDDPDPLSVMPKFILFDVSDSIPTTIVPRPR